MGAASPRKGKTFEQNLANYLRPYLPHIERKVSTGFNPQGKREVRDMGDLTGTDYLVWSAKDTASASRDQDAEYAGWMTALADMGDAAWSANGGGPRPIGLLVVKRAGAADVGRSWVHLTALDLFRLGLLPTPEDVQLLPAATPVRVRLADIVPAVVAWEARWRAS